MSKRRIDEQQVLTCLMEIEVVLNKRSLVRTLPPAHFIYNLESPSIDINYIPVEHSASKHSEVYKRGQSRLGKLCHEWRNDYLHSPRERHVPMSKSKKGERKRLPEVLNI